MSEAAVARFTRDLDRLAAPDARLGVAVSGGPDSLALLLLAAAARPGMVEAATVDHRLRAGSDSEAQMVAAVCAKLGVPHQSLALDWPETPKGNLQARARGARYEALATWAANRRLPTLATGHHVDDQAETLLLRLARGAGVGGLAGVRRRRPLGPKLVLIRPLLAWRRAELATVVTDAGLQPVDDPANADPQHDRTRARTFLSAGDWPDPARLAASAANLADAEEALQFTAGRLYGERHQRAGDATVIDASGLPVELKRRLLLIGLARRGAPAPRGPDLMRLIATLDRGGTATLGGIKAEGGRQWRLSPAPPRRA